MSLHTNAKRSASFLYDRMARASASASASAGSASSMDEVAALDELAFQSLRSVDLPAPVKDRALSLLRAYPNKKDLDRYGNYFFRKLRARACAETPRVLGSTLLPEKASDAEKTQLEKLLHGRGFAELAEAIEDLELKKNEYSEILNSALHDGADSLFKLFQPVYTAEACLVYLAQKFPGSYATNFRVLSEVARRVPDFQPRKLLDYGAGPGTATLATQRIWGERVEICGLLVEPSAQMRSIGNLLVSGGNFRWTSALYEESGAENFDLAVMSHVLMEMKTQEQRDNAISDLWRRLSQDGILVVIEKGTPTGFRYIHKIRENFIRNAGTNFHFVAPCPHESTCPLALTGRDWCHFPQNFQRLPGFVSGHASATGKDKFSYLVIRKGPGPRRRFGSEFPGERRLSAEERSFFWPRVVMEPIRADGHTLLDVCSAPNNFQRLIVNKAKPHAMGYRESREALWGDLWRWPKRLARADAREYVPDEVKTYLDRMKQLALRTLRRLKQEQPANKN